MSKQTNLAAQLSREAAAKALAEKKENAKVAAQPVPIGMVRVRLIRPCYDKEGVLHQPGIVELPADSVPSSAKVLAGKVEAPPPASEDEDEDEGEDDDKK